MSEQAKPRILLTNDDGIKSPGLWAAAEALSRLGFVTVAAPREQASGSGRSMPPASDGAIKREYVQVGGQRWEVFAVGGTPAQAVQHGILELMEAPPALVVAGINYGENVTTSVTISGTVGAAMEGAAFGVPSMAVSLQTEPDLHLSHSDMVDFKVAAHFTQLFAEKLLNSSLMEDVDLLKVDVPAEATVDTGWQITHLERSRYYLPKSPTRSNLEDPVLIDYDVIDSTDHLSPGSDAYVLRVDGQVAVTPLSLDLTSRVDLQQLEQRLR